MADAQTQLSNQILKFNIHLHSNRSISKQVIAIPRRGALLSPQKPLSDITYTQSSVSVLLFHGERLRSENDTFYRSTYLLPTCRCSNITFCSSSKVDLLGRGEREREGVGRGGREEGAVIIYHFYRTWYLGCRGVMIYITGNILESKVPRVRTQPASGKHLGTGCLFRALAVTLIYADAYRSITGKIGVGKLIPARLYIAIGLAPPTAATIGKLNPGFVQLLKLCRIQSWTVWIYFWQLCRYILTCEFGLYGYGWLSIYILGGVSEALRDVSDHPRFGV